MAIPRDPYAKTRGRLTYGQELAIITLGNYGKPLNVQDFQHARTLPGMLAQLEDMGYAFAPAAGKLAGKWMLTESGIKQYRRLKFGTKP